MILYRIEEVWNGDVVVEQCLSCGYGYRSASLDGFPPDDEEVV